MRLKVFGIVIMATMIFLFNIKSIVGMTPDLTKQYVKRIQTKLIDEYNLAYSLLDRIHSKKDIKNWVYILRGNKKFLLNEPVEKQNSIYVLYNYAYALSECIAVMQNTSVKNKLAIKNITYEVLRDLVEKNSTALHALERKLNKSNKNMHNEIKKVKPALEEDEQKIVVEWARHIILKEYQDAVAIARLISFESAESDIIVYYSLYFNKLVPVGKIQPILTKIKRNPETMELISDIDWRGLWLYIFKAAENSLNKKIDIDYASLYTYAYVVAEFISDLGEKVDLTSENSGNFINLYTIIQQNEQALAQLKITVGLETRTPQYWYKEQLDNLLEEYKDSLTYLNPPKPEKFEN